MKIGYTDKNNCYITVIVNNEKHSFKISKPLKDGDVIKKNEEGKYVIVRGNNSR